MIAEYPPTLLAEVKEKTKDRQLTGFTPGQGQLNPDLMLVGEAPGRHEEEVNIPFWIFTFNCLYYQCRSSTAL